jgi:hypothetical protein
MVGNGVAFVNIFGSPAVHRISPAGRGIRMMTDEKKHQKQGYSSAKPCQLFMM